MAANRDGYFHQVSARPKGAKKRSSKKIPPEYSDGSTYLDVDEFEVLQSYSNKFEEWYMLMIEGFNIQLFGFGSKGLVLTNFITQWLSDERHLVISGFLPNITKDHVNTSLKGLLFSDGKTCNQLKHAASELEDINQHVFIVIHGMDNLFSKHPSLCDLITNLILSSNGYMHLMGSVDHVNSGIIWDSYRASKLNITSFHTPTYISYQNERNGAAAVEFIYRETDGMSLERLGLIYTALPPNSKAIFKLILQHYKEQFEDNNMTLERCLHVSFTGLYHESRSKFLVKSTENFKGVLKEFQDHKIVKVVVDSIGSTIIQLLNVSKDVIAGALNFE